MTGIPGVPTTNIIGGRGALIVTSFQSVCGQFLSGRRFALHFPERRFWPHLHLRVAREKLLRIDVEFEREFAQAGAFCCED